MKKIIGSTLLASTLIAQEIKTPGQIQAELDQAQKDFNTAKEMFIPWYTGPLITGSASNAPQGKINVQGYLYLNNQYATFNNDRKSINMPDIFTVQPLGLAQYGITEWLDVTAIVNGFFRWRKDEYAQGFGDTTVIFGLQLVKQTPWVPSIRFTVGESFPTGRYQRFDPNKAEIAATGAGAYQTQLGLFFNKIFWEIKLHPISLRFATVYTFSDHRVDVRGFNAYGGGFGTDGSVSVGQNIQADFGLEVSLTQKWVFAMDVAYTYSWESTFRGNPGLTLAGTPASVGGPSNDQLSLAPAIEYNVSANGGFIGGVWFSVTGRNSPNFVAGVLSYTQMF